MSEYIVTWLSYLRLIQITASMFDAAGVVPVGGAALLGELLGARTDLVAARAALARFEWMTKQIAGDLASVGKQLRTLALNLDIAGGPRMVQITDELRKIADELADNSTIVGVLA